jgi:modulator of FtsH protease HflC
MRYLLAALVLILVIVLVRMSFFTVGPTGYVYVTQFGRHVATYDGSRQDSDAGLHWRWPWPIQSLQRLDRRLQHFDLDGTELLTHDVEGKTIDKTLAVEAYVCWQIADSEAVDRFIRHLGSAGRARDILGKRINSLLGATIGQMNLDDLITTQRVGEQSKVDVTMTALQKKLKGELQEQARTDYGIELVDVRLRRFNHPPAVRDSIFERIRSERDKKAAYYRSEGTKQAANIRSAAEEQVRDLLAKARFEEEKLKGEADTEAAMIRNQAHSKDPEFYVFLKKLDKLSSILGDKTTLLLSSHRAVFDLLFEPPRPGNAAEPGRVAGAESSTPRPGLPKTPAAATPPTTAGPRLPKTTAPATPPTTAGSAPKEPVKGGG